ncbi:MAG TPA: hypothetical protein VEK33_03215 [Terriglobales bacterium]|nr:hypothetical protein [Terriglobales bacterium]
MNKCHAQVRNFRGQPAKWIIWHFLKPEAMKIFHRDTTQGGWAIEFSCAFPGSPAWNGCCQEEAEWKSEEGAWFCLRHAAEYRVHYNWSEEHTTPPPTMTEGSLVADE